MKSGEHGEELTQVERELIAYFVNAAQSIGLPRSYGEIYGLYFASEEPLALDDVITRLQISKGSASQGIRFLKSINALNPTYLPGDRRDNYTAELSLRRIADGFIKERIIPQLKDGTDRLKQLKSQYSTKELESIQAKITIIESWSKKAKILLPYIGKILGKSSNSTSI